MIDHYHLIFALVLASANITTDRSPHHSPTTSDGFETSKLACQLASMHSYCNFCFNIIFQHLVAGRIRTPHQLACSAFHFIYTTSTCKFSLSPRGRYHNHTIYLSHIHANYYLYVSAHQIYNFTLHTTSILRINPMTS